MIGGGADLFASDNMNLTFANKKQSVSTDKDFTSLNKIAGKGSEDRGG